MSNQHASICSPILALRARTSPVRYSPRGETVTIRAERADASIRFEVSDRGPGIPREYHDAVFQKYFQMPSDQSSGAGLGMFIAREIVHAHGGEIGLVSEPGAGSTFWFTLPLADPPGDTEVRAS